MFAIRGLCVLVAAASSVSALAQGIWREDFLQPTLDPSRWEVLNGDPYEIVGGLLRMDGAIIHSKEEIFGLGDWTLEVKLRYWSFGDNSRFCITNAMRSVWMDQTQRDRHVLYVVVNGDNQLRMYLQDEQVFTGGGDQNWWVVRMEKSAGHYRLYVSGKLIADRPVAREAGIIAMGYPTGSYITPWLEIDYIKVVKDTMRQPLAVPVVTGNAPIGQQDPLWTVKGPGGSTINPWVVSPFATGWASIPGCSWLSWSPTGSAPSGYYAFTTSFTVPNTNHIAAKGLWSGVGGNFTFNGVSVQSNQVPSSEKSARLFDVRDGLAIGDNVFTGSVSGTNIGGYAVFETAFNALYMPMTELPVTLGAYTGDAIYNGPSDLFAVLNDGDTGAPLPGRRIDFFANDMYLGNSNTDANGIAHLPWNFWQWTPSVAITAYYDSRDEYHGAFAQSSLTSEQHPVTITVDPVEPGHVGEIRTLRAAVTRTDTGDPVPNAAIRWVVGGNSPVDLVTDDAGISTIDHQLGDGDAPTATVLVTTPSCWGLFAGQATAQLSVLPTGTYMTLANWYYWKPYNVPIYTWGSIRTADTNVGVENRHVILTLDGNFLKDVVTGNKGYIYFPYYIPDDLAPGAHLIEGWFAGDALFGASSASGTLTILTFTSEPVVSSTVAGKVALGQYSASPAAVPITITAIQLGTGKQTSKTVGLGPTGTYSVGLPSGGTYDIYAQGPHWLRQVRRSVSVFGNAVVNFDLSNGDTNADNAVNLLDLARVLADLGKTGGPADIDGRPGVDLLDLSTVLTNLGKQGD